MTFVVVVVVVVVVSLDTHILHIFTANEWKIASSDVLLLSSQVSHWRQGAELST